MAEKKIDKNTVPEDFTMGLALVDAIPVIFFGINAVLLGILFNSPLLITGAILCFLAGAGKVLWKIIVAAKKKNVWFLFVQMRAVMPIGFLLMIASIILLCRQAETKAILSGFIAMPSLIFFCIGFLGMVLMMVFAIKLDSSDVKSNWIEQLTNGASQIAIFVGLLLMLLK